MTVTEVHVAIQYHADPSAWYPTYVLTETDFEASGFLYTYKGHSRNTSHMSEYWKWGS